MDWSYFDKDPTNLEPGKQYISVVACFVYI